MRLTDVLFPFLCALEAIIHIFVYPICLLLKTKKATNSQNNDIFKRTPEYNKVPDFMSSRFSINLFGDHRVFSEISVVSYRSPCFYRNFDSTKNYRGYNFMLPRLFDIK